jgi:cysteine desulfurase/selenocysteine lyase
VIRPAVVAEASGAAPLDIARIREEFPALQQLVRGRPLVYLDNAATTQKPRRVIEAVSSFYARDNANIHRGVHQLSERATAAYEAARDRVAGFLNAADRREVIFVRGATEGINLVAQSYARPRLAPGDEILVTAMEHHANIVPWQLVCEQTGARLRVAPMTNRGELLLDEFQRLLTERTRLAVFVHVSNVLGTVNPVARMTALAHEAGAVVLVDGAQAVSHAPVDVRALDADFYVFSGHKMYGPTGIGVLYGKTARLESMPPWQGGGDMIASVSFERTTYNELPYKFEAGTPHIAGAVGLGEAVAAIESIGLDRIAAHERRLLEYAVGRLGEVPGLQLVGTAPGKAAIVSFTIDGVHPHDIGTVLDMEGVAVRAGHHCCQPLMHRLGLGATTRASFGLYNTRQEVDALAAALARVREVFG